MAESTSQPKTVHDWLKWLGMLWCCGEHALVNTLYATMDGYATMLWPTCSREDGGFSVITDEGLGGQWSSNTTMSSIPTRSPTCGGNPLNVPLLLRLIGDAPVGLLPGGLENFVVCFVLFHVQLHVV